MGRIIALAFTFTILAAGAARAETLEDLLVERGVLTIDDIRADGSAADPKIFWKGGTRIEMPGEAVALQVNTLLQPRYEFIDQDPASNESSFRLYAARAVFSGTALGTEFNYRLETDFVGNKSADGELTPALLDGYLQWNPCSWFSMRMGQYKVPVGRQFVTPNAFQQIPDRSNTSDVFRVNYQPGVRAILTDPDKRFTFHTSLYNGESDGEGGPRGGRNYPGVDTKMLTDVGARWNITGTMEPYIDGDIDITQELAINVGAIYAYTSAQNNYHGLGLANGDMQRANVDANLKYMGYSLHSEFFWGDWENDLAGSSKPIGSYVQTGYMLTDTWEAVLRYGYTDCGSGDIAFGACSTAAGAVAHFDEAAAGINHFFVKHNLKAQLAYIYLRQDLKHSEDNVDNSRIILQLSAWL